MNAFDILIIGHLVGDFLFQTGWMAKYKSTRWFPLFVHALVYTVMIFLFGLFFGGLTLWSIVLVFVSHVIIDRRPPVAWWVRYIQRATGAESKWLSVVTDQIFHVIILGIVVWMTSNGF